MSKGAAPPTLLVDSVEVLQDLIDNVSTTKVNI